MFAPLRSFWRIVRARTRFEREMDDELRFHLESRASDLVRSGLSPEEAARRARLEFGNPEVYRDLCRESRRVNLVDDAQLDLRFAFRNVRRDALLSATIVVTLALGIGATATIFSLVSGVLLRPLPYPAPERLAIAGNFERERRPGRLFGPDYLEWRRQCRTCEGVAAFTGTWATAVSGGGEPDRVRIAHVSDNLFATMGVQPLLGRSFRPHDTGRLFFNDGTPSTPVTAIVLGHRLWQRRFGGDPGVVGRTLNIEGDAATVVGVMPEGFDFPGDADAWVPAAISQRRGNSYLQILVRRRPGVGQAAVQSELHNIALQLATLVEARRASKGATVMPLREFIVGDVRQPLLIFLGAVSFVLLIACANVANLLLAQAATRPKELAIRAALGATRFRIVRQLLTESLLLAVIGGAAGLLLSTWLLRMFVALAPPALPRLDSVAIDGRVLVFTAALSMLTGLLFGLAPIARTAKPELGRVLHEGGGRTAGSVAQHRMRRLLVIAEVSLALVLLIGAGLLTKSFLRLQGLPTGFDPNGVITAAVTLPESTYGAARAKTYYREALDALKPAAGVDAAALVSALPLAPSGARVSGSVTVEGQPEGQPDGWAAKLAVGGDYFRAVGIPLLRGRTFNSGDTESAPGVAIVSESLARALWPTRDALGMRLNIGFGGEGWREVVGIVGDVRQNELGAPPLAAVYHPFDQVPAERRWMLADITFAVRTTGAPESFAPTLRATLARLDTSLPIYDVAVLTDVVARQVTDPRFYTMLLGAFSTLALILAAAGLYGLLSYSVTQRSHEIGIRMALGARAGDVMRLVVREGMLLVAAGSAIGVAGAYAATRVLSGLLYDVSVTDRPTFASIVVLLACVAAVACYVPARRASTVDPLIALRHE